MHSFILQCLQTQKNTQALTADLAQSTTAPLTTEHLSLWTYRESLFLHSMFVRAWDANAWATFLEIHWKLSLGKQSSIAK